MFIVSLLIIAAGIASMAINKMNWGIDFTGGYIIQYETGRVVTDKEVRDIIDKLKIEHNPIQFTHGNKGFLLQTKSYDENAGEQNAKKSWRRKMLVEFRVNLTELDKPVVPLKYLAQDIGDINYDLAKKKDIERLRKNIDAFLKKEFKGRIGVDGPLVVMPNAAGEKEVKTYNADVRLSGVNTDAAFKDAARAIYLEYGGEKPTAETRMEEVSPVFSGTLINRAALALFIATMGILIYTWFRFELWFAVAAIIALIHDCAITIGAYSLLKLEVNLTFVAVVLTVFGYSINDTIIIFDRVRENMRKYKNMGLGELINISLWETMARSINTVMTTQITLTAIIIFGGLTMRDFSLGLSIGILAGGYSSIFIAAPLAYMFKKSAGGGREQSGTAALDPHARARAEKARLKAEKAVVAPNGAATAVEKPAAAAPAKKSAPEKAAQPRPAGAAARPESASDDEQKKAAAAKKKGKQRRR